MLMFVSWKIHLICRLAMKKKLPCRLLDLNYKLICCVHTIHGRKQPLENEVREREGGSKKKNEPNRSHLFHFFSMVWVRITAKIRKLDVKVHTFALEKERQHTFYFEGRLNSNKTAIHREQQQQQFFFSIRPKRYWVVKRTQWIEKKKMFRQNNENKMNRNMPELELQRSICFKY